MEFPPPFTLNPPTETLVPVTYHNFRGVRRLERLLLFAISLIHVYFSCVIPVFLPVTSPLHVEALLHLLLVLRLRTSSELY